ncbi:aldolase/citrate lyase family protein [Halomonas sp. CSM-2]|uniref:aldolase/citrate lyase family protein n=1 Tax=Halomonas sp. CSM-2 TaxID=1975722 RepID=UPI000A2880AF|nr:HpcH/HpaI aldolase/citrate lyase family protein [Halomonas sp. CSM-2]
MVTPRYGQLGASLYVPATHKTLDQILVDGCNDARSIILCTEDAVVPDAVAWAVQRLIKALKAAPKSVPFLRFVRPRNPFVLRQLLESPDAVARLDGIVIPKFDHKTMPAWRDVLDGNKTLAIMPTLETPVLFREDGAIATLDAVQDLCNPVIALRIGANDLLGAIGLKRQPGQTFYDTPLRSTMERLITVFRPAGFELSAPVCDLIGEPDTLSREVALDIAWGFYAKTCVHPAQVALIEEHFTQAMARQQPQAHALLSSSEAVFKDSGQMLEATCHTNWAKRVAALQIRV